MPILYVQAGRNEDLNGEGAGIFYGFTRSGSINVETNYIDAAVLFDKTIFGYNCTRTYAFAGPAVGLFLSGSVHEDFLISKPGSESFGGDTTFDLQASGLDYSIVAGLGCSVKLNSGSMLFFNASYWYGLTNVFESYGGATYTRDVRLTAGVLFPNTLAITSAQVIRNTSGRARCNPG